jgi:hypothetical protein
MALQGYPGTLTTTVLYELMKDRLELKTTITARTDKATPGTSAPLVTVISCRLEILSRQHVHIWMTGPSLVEALKQSGG